MKKPVVVLLLVFVMIGTKAQTNSSGALLVLSKEDHTLAVVNPSTLKVVAKVPVGDDPHEVIVSADGKTAYVSIYGGGSLHTINVIDLVAQKRLEDIDTKPLFGPHGLAFANNKLWFTAEGSKAVASYNPVAGKLDWCMGTGQDRTHMLYVTGNAKKIYTTNVSSGTVSILQDTILPFKNMPPPPNGGAGVGMKPPPPGGIPQGRKRENWVQQVIPTSAGSEGFDVLPDGTFLWTASAEDGHIHIIDLVTRAKVASIDAKVKGANRLAFTPDGRLAFISSLGSGEVIIYDVKTRKLVKQVNIGHGAAGLLMDPDGTRAFVACTPDNYIAVIDLKTLNVTGKLEAGGSPDGLAWAAAK